MTRPVEFAQIVLTCLNEAITASPYPIPQEKICLRFGERVNPTIGTGEDECCTVLAWVRVFGIEPLDTFQDENSPCINHSRRITLELGTARCIPFGTTQAGPTCDQWTEAAIKMDSDHGAMEDAICCAAESITELAYEPIVRPGSYEVLGPDGNCISGTLLMNIDYDCGCTYGSP